MSCCGKDIWPSKPKIFTISSYLSEERKLFGLTQIMGLSLWFKNGVGTDFSDWLVYQKHMVWQKVSSPEEGCY